MTSIVDTSVKHFHSGMVGAPVLSGTAGALIALLDACLVNGFDVKAGTSLVVASGVATLSFSGTHSATVDSVPIISGVTGALVALNGEQKVTAIGSGFIKFATAAADGAAAGTVSFKMAPAGWTTPVTGTNLRGYKSADVAGYGDVLRVDDTGTTSCRVVGYEAMTDVSTGTGAFPTAAQMSGGGYWSKSSAANATANNWYLFADGRMLILHICPNSGANAAMIHGYTYGFGDVAGTRPGGDPYACFLAYSSAATAGDGAIDQGSSISQKAFPRSYTGLGSSVLHFLYNESGAPAVAAVSGNDTSSFGPFPSVVDGGLRLSSRYFATAINTAPRARLPGLYWVPMSLVFNTFKVKDKIAGTGALAGRQLFCLNPADTGSSASTPATGTTGVSCVDITGPWPR